MKEWYAVFTKLNCERKVSAILTRKGIVNYLPLVQSDFKRRSQGTLVFPNIVFVYLKKEEILKILQITEVINIVYWLDKPALVKEVEIELIKRFILEYKNISIQKIDINRDEDVCIISTEDKNTHNKLPKIECVQVTLPSLGFALIGERQKSYIKAVLDQSIAV